MNQNNILISKSENLDVEHYGHDTEWNIRMNFKKSFSELTVSKQPDGTYRLVSNTDGYHWLHYFLSNEPGTANMVAFSHHLEADIIGKAFSQLNVRYEIEDKESAFLIPVDLKDEDLVKAVAEFIYPRFENRERFFND